MTLKAKIAELIHEYTVDGNFATGVAEDTDTSRQLSRFQAGQAEVCRWIVADLNHLLKDIE